MNMGKKDLEYFGLDENATIEELESSYNEKLCEIE